ncbi:hypothetical protein ACS0VU_16000, partial [Aliiroseovarius sp. KMU-71]
MFNSLKKVSEAEMETILMLADNVLEKMDGLPVRRQGFWNQWLRKLIESLAHLVGFIMRRGGG